MPFPIKICAICKEEFELKPDKPGFANRCPQCTEESSAARIKRSRNQRPHDRRRTQHHRRKPTKPAVRPCAISSTARTADRKLC